MTVEHRIKAGMGQKKTGRTLPPLTGEESWPAAHYIGVVRIREAQRGRVKEGLYGGYGN
jgi:hypothetical protein